MNDSPAPPASPDKYGSRRSRRPCRPSSSAGPPQRSPRHARPDRHQDHRRRTQHPGSGRRDEAPAPPQPRAHQLPPTTLLARLPPPPPDTPVWQITPSHVSKARSHGRRRCESPQVLPSRLTPLRTPTDDGELPRTVVPSECDRLCQSLSHAKPRKRSDSPSSASTRTGPDPRFRRAGPIDRWWAILRLNQ